MEAREGSRSTQMSRAMEHYLTQRTSVKEAARIHNVPRHALYRMLKFANKTRPVAESFRSTSKDDPTEQEILERAAAIRQSWTPEERAKRWVASGRNDVRLEKMYGALRRAYRASEAA
jgi:transposase